jgi:glycosyltransferase involved in cell wall biosynthesis
MGNSNEKEKLKLSIITVNLNNREGLRKTIESVLSQTAAFFEFIIIDGCSSDGSVDLIIEHRDKIAFWISEHDNGIYQAMNKGIRAAKGEYLLFLNSGDFLVNNEIIEEVFKSGNKEDLIYGKSNISKEGKVIYTTPHPDMLTLGFFFKQTISHQAAFIRKNLFERYGYYREDYRIHSDLDFWIRAVILNNCSTGKLNLIVTDYNLGGISGSKEYEIMGKTERERILSENIPAAILADYKKTEVETIAMMPLLWAKNVKPVNFIITVLYKLAVRVNILKRRPEISR